jgi:Na+/phosphate symporter
MTGYLSLIVAAIGGIMYLTIEKPKWAEIGRILFFAGVLAFLLVNGSAVVGLLGK